MVDREQDDAALGWAGDEQPTRVEPPRAEHAPRVEHVETSAARTQMPAPVLVTYGILAGAYLIYTLGWVISVQRYNATVVASPEPLNAFMFGLGEILAILAPTLWFAAALVLTRGRKPVIRLIILLIGLVAVLPWPFVLGVWQ
jgi:hypothetical protein